MIDKYITVTGAVATPYTTVVPVGTSFADCLRAAGGCTVDDPTILISGVMMGGVSRDLTQPISKTTAGLIVLPSDHYLVRRKTAIAGNLHANRPRPVRSVFALHGACARATSWAIPSSRIASCGRC